jgi:hypothetical protein
MNTAIQLAPPQPQVFTLPAQPIRARGKFVCQNCGATAKKKNIIYPGSGWITFVLVLVIIIPGVIYQLWRMSKKRNACAQCGGNMLPVKTPLGREIVTRFYGNQDLLAPTFIERHAWKIVLLCSPIILLVVIALSVGLYHALAAFVAAPE